MTSAGPPTAFLDLRSRLAARRPPGPWTSAGVSIAEELSRGLDDLIRHLARVDDGMAVVAVGGYGREEMALESDVDLMVLHDGTADDEAIAPLLYPLWDAHLKVGHSVRTPRQVVEAAAENIETLTSLLGARCVAGSEALWGETENLIRGLLRRERDWIIAALKAEERQRRLREPFRLLAADTKSGRGGLRSLHSLGWERAVESGEGPSIPPGEAAENEARQVLLAVRNALHATTGQAADSFVFDARAGVAAWLGAAEGEVAATLYSSMRATEGLIDDRWPDLMVDLTDPIRAAGRWLVRSLRGRRVADDDLGGMAVVDAALDRPPGRLFQPIEELKLRRAGTPRWTASDRATLVKLLAADRRGHEVGDRLMQLGWLEKALPELAATYAMPQAAPFHEHPVDDHQWRTVSELLAVTGPDSEEPWYRDLAEDLGSLDELLIAALLHDVGKGRGGDHSVIGAELVESFARRAGFGEAATSVMAGSVRYHLLLPQVATRRDIGDSRVIDEVAGLVGDPQLVRMLALLTVADSRATGRAVWGPWKATLVRSLTARVLDVLSGTTPDVAPVDALVTVANGRFDRPTIEKHIQSMGSGYIHRFEPAEILRHLALSVPRPAAGAVAIDARHDGELTSLVVAALDRPGLLVIVAGVLALHGIDVLDARLTTSNDGVALDTFHVTNARRHGRVSDHTVDLVRRDVARVLSGELHLEEALARHKPAPGDPVGEPPETRFFSDTSTGEEIIEVRAANRTGLLHDVAAALFEEGLDVRLAKIDTRLGRVTDVFYVRGALADRERLERRLWAALRRE